MPRPLNIFVSYAREDEAAAIELEAWLRRKGHEPWIDKQRLLPGQNWPLELSKAVAASEVILVCLSRRSVAKTGYVQKELRLILEAAALQPPGKIFIIPIRLEDCRLPEALSELQYLDFFAPDAHERLARSLEYEEGKSAAVENELSEVDGAVKTARIESTDEIDAFVQATTLDDVKRILVITHTGGVTLRAVLAALRRTPSRPRAQLHILLRSPQLSDFSRAKAIEASLAALRDFAAGAANFEVEARFYAAPPLLRSIIFEHQGGPYSAYLSFYDWPLIKGLNQRGAANPTAIHRIRLTGEDSLVETFLSWFTHLWGRHRLHTLMFDFDDTLFLTTECQVGAWVEALRSAVDGKTFARADLAPHIRKLLDRPAELTAQMMAIFIEHQQEQEILCQLFSKLPPLNKLELLRRHRRRVREEPTAQRAIPIQGIVDDVRVLSFEYQIAIVSATSEILVRQVLDRHGLSDLFPYIIGREAPRQPWLSMENKTQQFLRISNITGVPLERMLFVGDSDADYKSAGQLGVCFLENRHNAMRHNVNSLIKSLDPEGHPFLVGGAGELVAAVKEMESKMPRLP